MNPLYNSNDSPNNATQPTKAVNRQGVMVRKSHNTFDLSYHNYTTMLYGYYYPFFCAHSVADEKRPLRSEVDIRSFAMKSPFLGNLTLNKDYFSVPMQSILPHTWELIFKNPSQGDDVPDDANCLIPADFAESVLNYSFGSQGQPTSPAAVDTFLKKLFTAELFFSSGSLLFNLGFKLNPIFQEETSSTQYSFDTLFDSFISNILGGDSNWSFKYTTSDGQVITCSKGSADEFRGQLSCFVTPSTAVSILRENPNFTFILYVKPTQSATAPASYFFINKLTYNSGASFSSPVNIDSVLAYQLLWSQFFINPQVDYIYNADIYRETFRSNFLNLFGSEDWYTVSWQNFSFNGNNIQYDYFSLHYFTEIFRDLQPNAYGLLHYIFGLRQSLRFGDYFTDSRTRPYAPGVMDAPVVGESVSAVDITKSIVMQRFLNNVVKLGNNFGDYLRGIFGSTPSPDYHFPKFISHSEVSVSGFEVSNTTSENQGALVNNLKTSADNYEFEVDIDMPCIVLGIASFSVPRVYSQTRKRFYFHTDRFDMFNPMLQFIGDQPVHFAELTGNLPAGTTTFGYQSRNSEYKQNYSEASGGFVEILPAWAFVSDSLWQDYYIPDSLESQNTDFIRAKDYEFDRFFPSLTGFSLGHKFHFIVHFNNQSVANLPMEVNPGIL